MVADVEGVEPQVDYVVDLEPENKKYSKIERWYNKEGLLHRDNDLPAEIFTDQGGVVICQKWYNNGILHRNGNLPAVLKEVKYLVGDCEFNIEKIWYKHGIKHRNHDKPAYVMKMKYLGGNQYKIKEWFINGKHRRVGVDDPARIKIDDNGHVTSCWYINGKLGRSDDKPALEVRDTNDELIGCEWYFKGKLHREDDKPAYYSASFSYNDTYFWFRHGKKWRDNGKPTFESRTKEGKLLMTERTKNGDLHNNDDLPAFVVYYTNAEAIKLKEWYRKGKLHREGNKPAKCKYYKDGNIKKESYYLKGKLKRPDNLPTIIWYNKDGRVRKFSK